MKTLGRRSPHEKSDAHGRRCPVSLEMYTQGESLARETPRWTAISEHVAGYGAVEVLFERLRCRPLRVANRGEVPASGGIPGDLPECMSVLIARSRCRTLTVTIRAGGGRRRTAPPPLTRREATTTSRATAGQSQTPGHATDVSTPKRSAVPSGRHQKFRAARRYAGATKHR